MFSDKIKEVSEKIRWYVMNDRDFFHQSKHLIYIFFRLAIQYVEEKIKEKGMDNPVTKVIEIKDNTFKKECIIIFLLYIILAWVCLFVCLSVCIQKTSKRLNRLGPHFSWQLTQSKRKVYGIDIQEYRSLMQTVKL